MRWSEEGGGGQARMKEHLFCFGGFRSSYRCNRIRTFNEQHWVQLPVRMRLRGRAQKPIGVGRADCPLFLTVVFGANN